MIRYLDWARDPESLLRDPRGVELFWSYLEEESLGHLLKFWLAVEGLKKESDDAVIRKYVRCISKSFSRSALSSELEGVLDGEKESLYKAQGAVKDRMLSGAYPNFLKSDIYLNYVRENEESNGSPSQEDNSSSRDFVGSHCGPEGAASVECSTEIHGVLEGSMLPTVPEESVFNASGKDCPLLMPSSNRLLSRENPSYPYHAMGSVYNPVSRQDSELASLSSGAYTTTDDNYSSFSELSLRKKQPKRRQINIHSREDRTIPRPARAGQVPPTPLSPRDFARLLSTKLQSYVDQKNHEKKTFDLLSSKLNNIELENAIPSTHANANNTANTGFGSDQSILDERVGRIWKDKTPINARSPGDLAGRPRSPPNSRHQHHSNKWNGNSRTLPSSLKMGKSQGFFSESFNSNSSSSKQGFVIPPSSSSSGGGPPPGQERIMEWVNKVSACAPEFSDDILAAPPSGGSGDPIHHRSYRSSSGSGSLHKHHHHHHSKKSSSSRPGMEWGYTHQQLQEVNRRLLLQGGSSSSSAAGSTSVTYTFSNEPEGMPYRVKIASNRGGSVSLAMVKNNLPKQGTYRFYFKTQEDGEAVYEEERDNAAAVPLWAEGKIIVQCRDDVV